MAQKASPRSFTFPSWHALPPTYTIQPIEATRDRQLQFWGT